MRITTAWLLAVVKNNKSSSIGATDGSGTLPEVRKTETSERHRRSATANDRGGIRVSAGGAVASGKLRSDKLSERDLFAQGIRDDKSAKVDRRVAPRGDGKDADLRKGLSEVEVAALKLRGMSQEQIAKRDTERRARGGLNRVRPRLMDIVAANAKAMIDSYGGRFLFSSKAVGRYLIDEGLHPDVDSYVGFGAVLGGARLELPWVDIQSNRSQIRFHDLTYVGRTLREKAVRREELLSFGDDVIRDLIAA